MKTLLLVLTVLLSPIVASGQNKCGLQEPLSVSELRGHLLFDYNGALFSVKGAEVILSEKGEGGQGVAKTSTDVDGRFLLKDIKPGSYFLSIEAARLPSIILLPVNIVSPQTISADGEIEFVIGGLLRESCSIRMVKPQGGDFSIGRSATSAEEAITEISLERTGCFGPCPVYNVTLRKDGTATYIGKEFVKRRGTFAGRLEYGFSQLAELVYRSGFFNLKDRYAAPYTDLDTAVVSVVRRGQRKTVEDYGGEAPIELWGIEETITALMADIKWESPRTRKTGPKSRGSH